MLPRAQLLVVPNKDLLDVVLEEGSNVLGGGWLSADGRHEVTHVSPGVSDVDEQVAALLGGFSQEVAAGFTVAHLRYRSEEHTSELQSLMRISYAVFCLKKKNKTNNKYKY